MSDLKNKVYKGVKRYWRRRGYRRLATTDEFRSKRSSRKWSWKIRMPRRLKIKIRFNPKKLIASFHDAYVRMMMRVANCPVVSGGSIAGYGGGGGVGQFGMRPMKEYDEKVIMQMYNSLVMRQAQVKALEDKSPQLVCSVEG